MPQLSQKTNFCDAKFEDFSENPIDSAGKNRANFSYFSFLSVSNRSALSSVIASLNCFDCSSSSIS